MAKPTLALIVPCYHPPSGWHLLFDEKVRALETALPQYALIPVIIVDGPSATTHPDQFKYLAKHWPQIRYYFFSHNYGKGAAIRYGVYHCKSDFYMYTDIDFPFELASMATMARTLIQPQAPDIIAGVKGKAHYNQVPFLRKWVSRGLRLGIRLLFRLPHSDTQTGLKAFNQKGRAIFLQTTTNRYLFDLEFLLLAHHLSDLRIEWQEVSLRTDLHFTPLNMRMLTQELYNFLDLWLQYIRGFGSREKTH